MVETSRELEGKNHRNRAKLKGAQIKSNRYHNQIKKEINFFKIWKELGRKWYKKTGKGNPTECWTYQIRKEKKTNNMGIRGTETKL